jgi:hypothetical protein
MTEHHNLVIKQNRLQEEELEAQVKEIKLRREQKTKQHNLLI